MKTTIISLLLLAISFGICAQHNVESVQINNLEWQKCQLEVKSNFTERWIEINTIEKQRYEFDYIKSYQNWLEGAAVNSQGQEIYIKMYFFKEYTMMTIAFEKGVVVKYLID